MRAPFPCLLLLCCSGLFLPLSAQDLTKPYNQAESAVHGTHIDGHAPNSSNGRRSGNNGSYSSRSNPVSSAAQLKASELAKNGLNAFNQKNFDLAAQAYREALQYAANDPDLLRGLKLSESAKAAVLALNCERRGDWGCAEHQWEIALELAPDLQWINERLSAARGEVLTQRRMREDLLQMATDSSWRASPDVGLEFAGPKEGTDKTASPVLAFMDSTTVAKREDRKQKEWDSKRLEKYASARPEPPEPQLGKSEIHYNGIQVALSDKASLFVQLVRDKTEHLPSPMRDRIRNAVFDYIVKHSVPENGHVFRDITDGTAADVKTLLESLKDTISSLASPDLNPPGAKSDEASEAVVLNTRDRVSETARDKAVTPIKDAVEKLASSSNEAPDKSARNQVIDSGKEAAEKEGMDKAIDYIKDAIGKLASPSSKTTEN